MRFIQYMHPAAQARSLARAPNPHDWWGRIPWPVA